MGLVLASQTSGANFDLRILKGRGGKAKFFHFAIPLLHLTLPTLQP
jgi:hypothetical protein